jgi:hypothetical protein
MSRSSAETSAVALDSRSPALPAAGTHKPPSRAAPVAGPAIPLAAPRSAQTDGSMAAIADAHAATCQRARTHRRCPTSTPTTGSVPWARAEILGDTQDKVTSAGYARTPPAAPRPARSRPTQGPKIGNAVSQQTEPSDVVVDPLLPHQRSRGVQHEELMKRPSPIDTTKELLITMKMILVRHHDVSLLRAGATLAWPALSEPDLGAQIGAAPAGRCKAPPPPRPDRSASGPRRQHVCTGPNRDGADDQRDPPPHRGQMRSAPRFASRRPRRLRGGRPGGHRPLSARPPHRGSFITRSQNLAPSVCSTQIPSTSFLPSRSAPTARWTALFFTVPASRTLPTITSRKITGQAGPGGEDRGDPRSWCRAGGRRRIGGPARGPRTEQRRPILRTSWWVWPPLRGRRTRAGKVKPHDPLGVARLPRSTPGWSAHAPG